MNQLAEEKKERATRSDKKKDIRPTVPYSLYDCISRLSYVVDTPMKDIGVTLCKKALYTTQTMEKVSTYFKRDYWATSSKLYLGDLDSHIFKFEKGLKKRRLTMRFKQKDYEQIARLAYSLDTTLSTATAILLFYAVKNVDIVNAYVSHKVSKRLDPQRMKQLKEIHKYVNEKSPYNDELPLTTFIMTILEEVKETTISATESVINWLDERAK